MREAHKTPCDDIYCEQFLCVQKRDSEGHVELKDWDKHTAELRASNAALKAENEALKTRCEMVYCAYCSFEARCPTDNKALTDHVKVCEFHPVRKLEAELKRYTSWTPQDPGMKEAM